MGPSRVRDHNHRSDILTSPAGLGWPRTLPATVGLAPPGIHLFCLVWPDSVVCIPQTSKHLFHIFELEEHGNTKVVYAQKDKLKSLPIAWPSVGFCCVVFQDPLRPEAGYRLHVILSVSDYKEHFTSLLKSQV